MCVLEVRASSSSPRLPLCQIFSFAAPIAELARGESHTQSISQSLTQLIWCPGFRFRILVLCTYRLSLHKNGSDFYLSKLLLEFTWLPKLCSKRYNRNAQVQTPNVDIATHNQQVTCIHTLLYEPHLHLSNRKQTQYGLVTQHNSLVVELGVRYSTAYTGIYINIRV